MEEVFVIRNQLGHYWGKRKTWVDGSEPVAVLRLKHHDEAANTLFELSSKDIDLRGDIVSAETNSRGVPILEVSDIPLPEIPVEEDPQEEESGAGETAENNTEEQL